MSRKEYFAYGSNLNFDQMAYRCPEATVVGTAKLLLPVSSRYHAVVMQGCLDAGISPQQFYDADEKYRKAYKARAAPVPKKHVPER